MKCEDEWLLRSFRFPMVDCKWVLTVLSTSLSVAVGAYGNVNWVGYIPHALRRLSFEVRKPRIFSRVKQESMS